MDTSSHTKLRGLAAYDGPLPQCEGPKLQPFKDRKAPVKFLRLLSDNEDDSDSGGHAHVFEVSIRGKEFALKVFKLYDDEEDRSGLIGGEKKRITVDLLRAHMDPFYNECRAYGRLIEGKVNGKVAVRCHGYTTIAAEIEEELKKKFSVVRWNRPDKEYAMPASERQPLRAIVKELVLEDLSFTESLAKKTLKDLRRIRGLGVYPMDVRGRNYKGGLLVDMSIAMTKPHFVFEIRPKWRVRVYQRQDLIMWESMMEEESITTWQRAVRNPKYCKKIRSYKKTGDSSDAGSEEGSCDATEAEISSQDAQFSWRLVCSFQGLLVAMLAPRTEIRGHLV